MACLVSGITKRSTSKRTNKGMNRTRVSGTVVENLCGSVVVCAPVIPGVRCSLEMFRSPGSDKIVDSRAASEMRFRDACIQATFWNRLHRTRTVVVIARGGLDSNETHPLRGQLRTTCWRLHGVASRWDRCDGCWPRIAFHLKAQTPTLVS